MSVLTVSGRPVHGCAVHPAVPGLGPVRLHRCSRSPDGAAYNHR